MQAGAAGCNICQRGGIPLLACAQQDVTDARSWCQTSTGPLKYVTCCVFTQRSAACWFNNAIADINLRLRFSAHWLHYVKIWRHPQSRKYITYCTVVTSSKEDRATATGNMYRKVGENWICGIEMCERTDRQTKDRQMNETYRHADRNTLLSCRGRNNNLYFDRVINGYAYSHL